MLINNDKLYIINTYPRIDVEITHGKGVYLYDSNNNKYLDMYSGVAVNSLGHQHERLMKALYDQAGKYLHLSNYFVSKPVVELAELIIKESGFKQLFFTNTGAEANETNIKIAKKYGRKFSEDKCEFICLQDSFHGRTIGALSVTSQIKYQKDFFPLMPGVKTIKRDSIEELNKAVSEKTCAIILEIIQGESGVQPLTNEFLEEVNRLAKKHNFLIIADEVQTGFFRTGSLFAYLDTPLKPDLISVAKALGGGLPLGASIASKELADILGPGDHGATFGGNPLASAIGLEGLKIMLEDDFQKHLKEVSNYLNNKLLELKDKYSIIKEVRGKGMMYGIEIGEKAEYIKLEALKKKLLLNVANQTTIRLLPPLIMKKEEVDIFVTIFEEILKDL